MRPLNAEQITKLAARKGVKTVAVENFLGSVGASGESASDALNNLRADAVSYKWNAATVRAITDGIMMARNAAQS